MHIVESIRKITSGHGLTRTETELAFNEIMSGMATEAQIAAFLVGLKMHGETVEEITGAATIMRQKATKVHSSQPHLLDTCGTGGDGANTFNISTAAAIVAAGAGAVVAKHGNRSMSSQCGSADVLEALGVNVSLNHDGMQRCLDSAGICFMFAQTLHGAMKYAAPVRKQLGIRSIFNILGPLTNPAGARHQLLGVFDRSLTSPLAEALGKLGSEHVFVVHGDDGLDEVTTSTKTHVAEFCNQKLTTFEITPEQFGLKRISLAEISGSSAAENAEIIRRIVQGAKGAHRDITILNAAFALRAVDMVSSIEQGLQKAEEAIDSGAAEGKLNQLIKTSQQL